jgi:arylsulfatase A-like enzyme
MRWWIVTILTLVALGACGDSIPPVDPRSDRDDRPNVIYILADDLGYGELGSYGQTNIQTPHLDRLSDEGMRFTQHYSGSPVCAPSRATLLTGMHTGHTLVRDNYELGGFLDEEERGQLPLEPGTETIGTMLQARGYVTAAMGKWGLGGPGSTGVPNEHGFGLFYGYLDQKQAHNYYPTHLWRNAAWDSLGNEYFHPHQRLEEVPTDPSQFDRYKGTDYAPDLMTDGALRFIRSNRDLPFFLYLAYPIPHVALQVPDEALQQYDFDETPYLGQKGYLPHRRPLAAYAAMIGRLDGYVGQIIGLLEELGLDEDTLVLFSSDNGPTFNGGVDAAFFRSAGPFRGLKTEVYEGGIRVPFLAWWPGHISPGTTSDHISAFWDVMPTVAEATGADTPDVIDGISFLPTLLGQPDRQAQHEYLYWEYHGRWDGAQAVRMDRWKGVRVGGHSNPDAPIELYDLATDIGETTDLAAAYADVVRQIQAIMDARTPSEIEGWNFAQAPLP